MSLRMVSLWIVGALLVAATLKADPPQKGLAPELPLKPGVKISAENNRVVVEGAPGTLRATSVEFFESPQQQIRFDVKVWDVDHSKLRVITKSDSGVFSFYRVNGLAKLPEGITIQPPEFDLSISPLTAPFRAFAVRNSSVSKTLHGHDISSAFKTITEPTLVATNGREATMLSGGEVPIFTPRAGDSDEIAFHEFGLKLKILPRLMDQGRLALGLDFEHCELDRKPENDDSGIPLISSQGFRLSAQLKLGEQLLVAQQIGKQDVTRLVQIQPTLFVEQQATNKPQDAKPATVSKSRSRPLHEEPWPTPPTPGESSPAPKDITVEDRWPIDDMKVGDEVIPVFVFMNRNRTAVGVLSPSDARKLRLRVVAISKSERGEGLRVTLRSHMAASSNDTLEEFQERADLAMTCCLLSTSGRGFNQKAALRDVLETLPASIGLVPVELAVEGVWRIPADEDIEILHADDHYDIEKVDGRYPEWPRLIAKKPGLGRLIFAQGDSYLAQMEILVKADTRELELHIRQQFPAAEVTMTSVGANSLMLKGTVGSEEDATGIVELAEQFAPKVLNRLKVGAAIGSRTRESSDRSLTTSATEPRAVRQANGIADNADSNSTGERGGVSPPVERDRTTNRGADATPLAESKITEPQRVRPLKAGPGNSPKSEELEQLRDEIRELRQDVRELIQRLDREPAAASAQPPVTPPTKTTLSTGEPWKPARLAHQSIIENAWQMLGLRFVPLTEPEKKQLLSKYQGGMKVTEVRADSPASQNNIRKDDILVGLHVWETTTFDNLQYVLGHPHVVQHGTLKFYVVRGTETLFGELKIVTPAMPMPSNMRIGTKPPRSIALSDLPNKLETEFDKLKLHIEVHRALIETALEARGITVTDEEARQLLQLHADRDSIPVDLFLQAMKLTPMGQQFLQASRQQLALVKYSGQTTEPTEQELRDAYQLAQAGRVASQQVSFADKAKAEEVAREVRQNPQQFADIAAKHGQANSFTGRTLIPTIPPAPQDEVLAKLKDGEVSDVIPVGDQFVIYQRQRIVQPQGTFDDLKRQLRATLILNKTNEIGQREVEQLRKAYRLIIVPAGAATATAEPAVAIPVSTLKTNAE